MIDYREVETKDVRLTLKIVSGDTKTRELIRTDKEGYQEVLRKTLLYMKGQLNAWQKEREGKDPSSRSGSRPD